MTLRSTLALLALVTFSQPASAQHGHAAPPQHTAPREASQFDFLVGEWEIVAQPHVSSLAARLHGSPKFPGTWKAWRGLDGWGIEDEVRLTDESGNPRALTHSVRVYDSAARHWNLSSLDVYGASFQPASAEWRDGEMHVSSRGTDAEGRAYVARARFHDITPDSFRLRQDRSYDDGHTWAEGFLKLEAKRVGPASRR